MTIITTCLLENNHLIREGLKSILADTDFSITEAPANMLALRPDPETVNNLCRNMDLVIIGLDEYITHPEGIIGALKSQQPACRVALLGASTQAEFIRACFAQGADGYLARNLSPCALINSLQMIMAGEKIFPATALDSVVRLNRQERQVPDHNLSVREHEILRHLARGQTNKEIALQENITESTVKAHIKTILRKLRLSNRTQAAHWAWTEGLIAAHAMNDQAINAHALNSMAQYKQTQSMM